MTLFSQKELLIMAVVVGGLLVVILYLTILDVKDYLKNKKSDIKEEVVNDFSEEVKNEEIALKEENVVVNPPVGSMAEILEEVEILDFDEPEIIKKESIVNNVVTPSVENVNIVEVPMELTRDEAKAELERVSMELESIDNKDPFEDTITNFEIEQEENAIISLDELVKISDNLYDSNEAMQYDEGNEPITIDEVINKFNNSNNITEEANQVSYSEVNPIMSFYGYENTHNEMQFENTANYDKLDMELRKTNDFLNSLKEMHEKHEN